MSSPPRLTDRNGAHTEEAGIRRLLSWESVWPAALLLLGACFPIARILADPAGLIPGTGLSDTYKHCWGLWHTLAQFGDGTWPDTRYLNAPEGGRLPDIMWLPGVVMAPVTLAVGPVLALNLWVLLSLFAIGAATYALCKEMTQSTAGAMCAGLAAQSAPFLLGYPLTSGVTERLTLWVFPLVLLCLLRVRRGRGGRWIWLVVAGVAVAVLQCAAYGVFLVVLLLFSLPALLWLRPWWGLPRLRLPLLLSAAGFGVEAAGAMVVYRQLMLGEKQLLAGTAAERLKVTVGTAMGPQGTGPWDKAWLDLLFNPITTRGQVPDMLYDELHKLMYIGWVPLLAMVAGGVVAWRRGRTASPALEAVGLVFVVLSLGLHVFVADMVVVNPVFVAVSYLVPVFGRMPTVWQMAGVLPVVSAVGMAELVGAMSHRRRATVAIVLFAAVLAERFLVVPVRLPVEVAPAHVPDIYDRAVGEGGLADLPAVFKNTEILNGMAFLGQTRHGHPLPIAINPGRGRGDYYSPLFRGSSDDWTEAVSCFKAGGYRWLVVHRDWFAQPQDADKCIAGLRLSAGGPMAFSDQEALFDLSMVPFQALETPSACPWGEAEPPERTVL